MTAKFKAGESAGTYVADAPVTEADIVEMAQHLASKRLRKGQALHQPKEVFSYPAPDPLLNFAFNPANSPTNQRNWLWEFPLTNELVDCGSCDASRVNDILQANNRKRPPNSPCVSQAGTH